MISSPQSARVQRQIGWFITDLVSGIIATAAAGPVGTAYVVGTQKQRSDDRKAYEAAIAAAGGDWRDVGYDQNTGQYYVREGDPSASWDYLESIVGPDLMGHISLGGWRPIGLAILPHATGLALAPPGVLPGGMGPIGPADGSLVVPAVIGGMVLLLTLGGIGAVIVYTTQNRR